MPAASKPGQVLVFSGVRGDTRRYRTLHLYEQLRLAGVSSVLTHLMDPRLPALAQSAPLVIIHRVANNRYVEKLFHTFRKNNALVILDTDDYLYDPQAMQWINSPDFADPVRASLYRSTLLQHRETLERVDAVTVSTGYLAGLIQPFGKPAWVHRNAFSLEMHRITEAVRSAAPAGQDAGKVVIGYASGTPTHNRDFEMIQPVLKLVMERYPQVELHLLGPLEPGEDWGDLRQRIRRYDLVPWRKLPELLAEFDINLAPLVLDNPFAQSKSEIKYMEAGMLSIPTVASPTDAFRFAIHSGDNGFLAASPQDWLEQLSALVENSPLCRQMGESAYQAVTQAYHPATRAGQLAQLLEDVSMRVCKSSYWQGGLPSQEAIQARSQQVLQEDGWSQEPYEQGPDNLQMGLFTLKTMGLSTTLKYVWIFLRRLLAPVIPFQRKPGKP